MGGFFRSIYDWLLRLFWLVLRFTPSKIHQVGDAASKAKAARDKPKSMFLTAMLPWR